MSDILLPRDSCVDMDDTSVSCDRLRSFRELETRVRAGHLDKSVLERSGLSGEPQGLNINFAPVRAKTFSAHPTDGFGATNTDLRAVESSPYSVFFCPVSYTHLTLPTILLV